MIQLVYASAACNPFTPGLLKSVLAKARARNTLYGVTGMLLYHSGSFLQILEGPPEGVQTIFGSIARDPRHTQTKTLLQKSIAVREFEEWKMGFADTSAWPQNLPGLVDYHRALPLLSNAPTEAKRYLHFFQQGLCRQALAPSHP